MRSRWWAAISWISMVACAELRGGEVDGGDGGSSDAASEVDEDAASPQDASLDQKAKDGAATDARPDASDGAPSDAGVRVPEVLVSGLTKPLELVVSGDTLYYTQDSDSLAQVRKVLTDGGSPDILAAYDAASGQNPIANDLVVVGPDVFWANATASAGRIFAAPKAGGATRNVGGLFDSPYRLTAYGAELFFVDRAFSPATYAIQRMPNTGGPTTAIAEYQIRVGGIAVDATGIYWTHGGPLSNGKNGLRKSQHGAADAAVDLHVGIDNGTMGGLALDPSDVFWAEASGGRILRVGKSGGLISVLADTLDGPLRVVLDGGYVYFTEHGTGSAATGTIRRVPMTGGASETLASAQDHPVGLAVDATHVYWTNYDGGEVMRVKK